MFKNHLLLQLHNLTQHWSLLNVLMYFQESRFSWLAQHYIHIPRVRAVYDEWKQWRISFLHLSLCMIFIQPILELFELTKLEVLLAEVHNMGFCSCFASTVTCYHFLLYFNIIFWKYHASSCISERRESFVNKEAFKIQVLSNFEHFHEN